MFKRLAEKALLYIPKSKLIDEVLHPSVIRNGVLVKASAGAGKTTLLVRIYFELLKHGVLPEEIVFLTFTREAARSFKERILSVLRKVWGDCEDFRGYIVEFSKHFSKAVSGTFHSFFSSVVENFYTQVGAREFVTGTLEEALKAEYIDHFLNLRKSDEKKYEIMNYFARKRLESYFSVEDLMWDEVDNWLDEVERKWFKLLKKLRFEIEILKEEAIREGLLSSSLRSKNRSALNEFVKKSDVDDVLKRLLLKNSFSKVYNLLNSIEEDVKKIEEGEDNLFDIQVKEEFIEFIRGWRKFLKERGVITYSSVQQQAKKIMRSNSDYFFEKYRYFLIDEVQDLNMLQLRILEDMRKGFKNTVLVGDVKQSIYGFRGSQYFVVDEIENKVGKVLIMEDNWRSCSEVVRRLNEYAITYFREGEQKVNRECNGKVEFYCADSLENVARFLQNGYCTFIVRRNIEVYKLWKELNKRGFVGSVYGGDVPIGDVDLNKLYANYYFYYSPYPPAGLKRFEQFFGNTARQDATFDKAIEIKSNTVRRSNLSLEAAFAYSYSVALQEWELFSGILKENFVRFYPKFRFSAVLPRGEDYSIYTVHQAKGLEFERVVVFVSKPKGRGQSYGKYGVAFFDRRGNRKIDEVAVLVSKAVASLEELNEERRIYYVALSRAENELYVVFSKDLIKEEGKESKSDRKELFEDILDIWRPDELNSENILIDKSEFLVKEFGLDEFTAFCDLKGTYLNVNRIKGDIEHALLKNNRFVKRVIAFLEEEFGESKNLVFAWEVTLRDGNRVDLLVIGDKAVYVFEFKLSAKSEKKAASQLKRYAEVLRQLYQVKDLPLVLVSYYIEEDVFEVLERLLVE